MYILLHFFLDIRETVPTLVLSFFPPVSSLLIWTFWNTWVHDWQVTPVSLSKYPRNTNSISKGLNPFQPLFASVGSVLLLLSVCYHELSVLSIIIFYGI